MLRKLGFVGLAVLFGVFITFSLGFERQFYGVLLSCVAGICLGSSYYLLLFNRLEEFDGWTFSSACYGGIVLGLGIYLGLQIGNFTGILAAEIPGGGTGIIWHELKPGEMTERAPTPTETNRRLKKPMTKIQELRQNTRPQIFPGFNGRRYF